VKNTNNGKKECTMVGVIPVETGIYNPTIVDSLLQGNDIRSVIIILEASQLKNINSGFPFNWGRKNLACLAVRME